MSSIYTVNLALYYIGAIFITIMVSIALAYLLPRFNLQGNVFRAFVGFLPYLLICAYFLLFWRLDTLLSIRSQIYTNIITNIFTGIIKGTFTFTVNDFNIPLNIFKYYFAPMWLLLAPLSAFFNNHPLFLHGLQSVVLAVGAIPIIRFSKERFKNPLLTIGLVLCYLLSFFIQSANLWSVEVRTMSTTLISWAIYFLLKDKLAKFLVMLILFLLCGTPNSILVISLGLYIFLIMKDKKKLGLIVFAVGIAYLLLGLWVSSSVNPGINLYAKQVDYLKGLLFKPTELLQFILKPKFILVILLLLLPVGFLSLGEVGLFLTILPSLYMNFAVFNNIVDLLLSCYSLANLVPPVIFSAIMGMEKMQTLSFFKARPKIKKEFAVCILSTSILGYIFFNPFSFQGLYWPGRFSEVTISDFKVREMLSTIPKDASVSADNRYRMALADRREIYMLERFSSDASQGKFEFPMIKDADFAVISKYAEPQVLDYAKEKLLKNKGYGVSGYSDGVIVFEKGVDRSFKECVKAGPSEITNYVLVNFNNEIVLRGFNLNKAYFKPGEECRITLFWETLNNVKEDLRFLIRLTKYNKTFKEVIYQPFDGFYPTNLWQKGDFFKEEISLRLPKEIILSKEPLLVEIYPLLAMPVIQNEFIPKLSELKSVRDKKEMLHKNIVGAIYLIK